MQNLARGKISSYGGRLILSASLAQLLLFFEEYRINWDGFRYETAVECNLKKKGAFLWENPNPDSCIQKRILCFFT